MLVDDKMNLLAENASASSALEMFLIRLRYKDGKRIEAGANRSFTLSDPETIWFISSGRSDVFASRMNGTTPEGARFHLFRADENQLLFGMPREHVMGLVISQMPDTEIISFPISRLRDMAQNTQYRALLMQLTDAWIEKLGGTATTKIPPKDYKAFETGRQITLKANQSARPKKGVMWVKQLEGESLYVGNESVPFPMDTFIPLSAQTWIETKQNSVFEFMTSDEYFVMYPEWDGIHLFHNLLLTCIQLRFEEVQENQAARLQARTVSDRMQVENAFNKLAGTMGAYAAETTSILYDTDPLFVVSQIVGDEIGLVMKPDPGWDRSSSNKSERLALITRASQVRTRQVALRGDWWLVDNGPLIAYVESSKRPVALLREKEGYQLYDPVDREYRTVTPEIAAELDPFAQMFYRPFPAQALSAVDMMRFGLRGTQNDLRMVLLIGLIGGIVGMAVPIMTGILFDSVIPAADQSQLVLVTLMLLVIALSSGIFQVTRAIALLRIEGRMDVSVQAAVWDRLLSLPAQFFREYSAGDLSSRVMGITAIRRILFGTILSSILSVVFSVFSLILLFLYDPNLAIVAVGLVIVSAIVTTAAGLIQVRYQRRLTNLEGQISGMVLQFINGMSKFRVSGSEGRAFARWADDFSQQRRLTYRVRTLQNNLAIFNSAYPVITSIVLFMLISQNRTLTTGTFLAFSAAFGQFLGSVLQLSSVFTVMVGMLPIYERAKPILKTQQEVDESKINPGELSGQIEVNHVTFRYKDDGPLILKDISMLIHPGEFVALVGASGCGKSTLFRLLLGFETPSSGAIFYDDKDLSELDIQSIRRQLGVVLQNSQIMPGDIFQNIVGNTTLTVDDAWAAARMAGLDGDIQQMPMGMHTFLSEGASTLSGGQRQRLMIARAIVHKPRIVFFDEATSALDNRTQAIVSESLERLDATRIVIAHRLSTIINADRIFVMDSGQIVQVGTYQELSTQPGLFAELARRQII